MDRAPSGAPPTTSWALGLNHSVTVRAIRPQDMDLDVRLENGSSCEFAIAVADQWQGCGIGARLLRELIAIASRSGITELVGDVLSTNVRMFALARAVGMNLQPHPPGMTLRRLVLSMPGAAPSQEPAVAGVACR